MIQTIVTHRCPKCGSSDRMKNGHDYKGSQKYHCKTCESYGTLQAQRDYDEATREQVKRAILGRISLRGIERVLGISRHTLAEWIGQWVAQLPPLETTLIDARLDDG